jgi:hypothetical protein
VAGVESGGINNKKPAATDGQPAEKPVNFFDQLIQNIPNPIQQFTNPHQSEAHKLADNHGAQVVHPKETAGNGHKEVSKPVENHGTKTLHEQAVEADQKIHHEIHKLTEQQVNVIHKRVTQVAETIQNELKGLTVNPVTELLGSSVKHSVANAPNETNHLPETYKAAKTENKALNNMGAVHGDSVSVPSLNLFNRSKSESGTSQENDSNGESFKGKQDPKKEVEATGLVGALARIGRALPSLSLPALEPVNPTDKSDGDTKSGAIKNDAKESVNGTDTTVAASDSLVNAPPSSHGNSGDSCAQGADTLTEHPPQKKGTDKIESGGNGKGKVAEGTSGQSSASAEDHSGDAVKTAGKAPEGSTTHGGKTDDGAGTGPNKAASEPKPGPTKADGTIDLATKSGLPDASSATHAPAEGADAGKNGGIPVKETSGSAHGPSESGADSSKAGSTPVKETSGAAHGSTDAGGESSKVPGKDGSGSAGHEGGELGKNGGSPARDGGQDGKPTSIDPKSPESKSGEPKLPEAPSSSTESKSSQPTESKTAPTESKPSDTTPLPVQKTADSKGSDKQPDPAGKTDGKADTAQVQYAKSAGTSSADSSSTKDVIMPAKQIASSMARSSVDGVIQVDQALQKLLYAKVGDGQSSKLENAPSDSAASRNENKLSPQDGKQVGDGRAIAFAADGKTPGDGRSQIEGRPLADGKASPDAKQIGEVRPVDGKAGDARVPELKPGDLRPVDKSVDAKAGEGVRDNRVMTPDGQGKGELPPRRQEGAQAGTAAPIGRVDGQPGAGTAGALTNDPRIFGGKGPGDDNTNKNSPIENVNNAQQPVKIIDPQDGTRKESTTKHAGADGKSVIDGGLIPLIPIFGNGGSNGSDYTGIGKTSKNHTDSNGAKTQKKAGRVKYTIKFGDTLESIAAGMLKDVRYASLLMTINRATLKIIQKDGRAVVQLLVGEQIWLPAETEMEVHRQAFFVDSFSAFDQSPAGAANKSHQADRQPASLHQAAKQGMPPLPAAQPPSGQAIFDATPQGQTWISVSKITETCQILVADPGDTDTVFSIRLQLRKQGQWVTIAAYESHFGKNVRYVYRQDGSRVPFQMDLPAQVIKSMAKEDFASHWRAYEKAFLLNDLKYL